MRLKLNIFKLGVIIFVLFVDYYTICQETPRFGQTDSGFISNFDCLRKGFYAQDYCDKTHSENTIKSHYFFSPKTGNSNSNSKISPKTGNSNSNSKISPKTGNSNSNSKISPKTGNSNGNSYTKSVFQFLK